MNWADDRITIQQRSCGPKAMERKGSHGVLGIWLLGRGDCGLYHKALCERRRNCVHGHGRGFP